MKIKTRYYNVETGEWQDTPPEYYLRSLQPVPVRQRKST